MLGRRKGRGLLSVTFLKRLGYLLARLRQDFAFSVFRELSEAQEDVRGTYPFVLHSLEGRRVRTFHAL